MLAAGGWFLPGSDACRDGGSEGQGDSACLTDDHHRHLEHGRDGAGQPQYLVLPPLSDGQQVGGEGELVDHLLSGVTTI